MKISWSVPLVSARGFTAALCLPQSVSLLPLTLFSPQRAQEKSFLP